MAEYKRPNHDDFRTTTELKAAQFSGMRANTITSTYELWVVGVVEREVSFLAVAADPLALTKAHAEFFGIMK